MPPVLPSGQAPGGSPTGKHVIPVPQSSVTGTGRSDTRVDMCRRWTFLKGATLAFLT